MEYTIYSEIKKLDKKGMKKPLLGTVKICAIVLLVGGVFIYFFL